MEERVGRLEAAVERLAEAQARTEERVGRLEAIVEQLAQAQARGEERMARLEAVVEELVHAQARMEERVGRLEEITAQLAQGQAELREAMKALAEEQVRMQKELRHLAKQVGGLSETLGADLEDLAYIVLHDVLKRELGWDVGPLEHTFHRWNDRLEEINVFGRATDPARPGHVIWIVGEAKYNLTIREVDRFAKLVERARKHLIGEIFPVCFCRRARPEVQEHVRKLGLRLVFSYGRLI
jgi:exonuclease VII small subunit